LVGSEVGPLSRSGGRSAGRRRVPDRERVSDGDVVWISGEFELIEAPVKLVYTWRLGPATAQVERVTVKFEAVGAATEVVIVHERISTPAARDEHEQGWVGCLDGLEGLLARPA
jgi:uncharacterized protein YndB with AHSA1/START domain